MPIQGGVGLIRMAIIASPAVTKSLVSRPHLLVFFLGVHVSVYFIGSEYYSGAVFIDAVEEAGLSSSPQGCPGHGEGLA